MSPFCISFASVLSAVSLILLIFVHISQINTSTVPRSLYLVKVNVSGYGQAIEESTLNPASGLYTTNASAPLQAQAGLRQFYKFGLYSYCGYVDDKTGTCGNQTFAQPFKPYDMLTADMLQNYSDIISPAFIPDDTTFRDSKYLAQSSKAAYWLLLLGTIAAVLALLTGIAKNNLTFFVSTVFAVIGSLFLLVSASIWTVIISKTEGINTAVIPANQFPLLIFVSKRPTLFVIWAASACMAVSVVPYMIICCTYRG